MANISEKYQKDYKNVTFQNPRMVKDQEMVKRRWGIFVTVCLILLGLGVLYGVLYSPLVRVSTITIEGVQRINRERLESLVYEYRDSYVYTIFPRKTIWFFSETGLREAIGPSYLLDQVSIRKQYPRGVTITISEKQAQISWTTGDHCYQLDDTGSIIAACDAQTQDFIKIKDLVDNTAVTNGAAPVTKERIEYILRLQQRLQEQLHPLVFYVNFEGPDSLKVQMGEGYSVYFNAKLPADDQVSRLYIVLADPQLKDTLKDLTYIDMRFGEQIYFK